MTFFLHFAKSIISEKSIKTLSIANFVHFFLNSNKDLPNILFKTGAKLRTLMRTVLIANRHSLNITCHYCGLVCCHYYPYSPLYSFEHPTRGYCCTEQARHLMPQADNNNNSHQVFPFSACLISPVLSKKCQIIICLVVAFSHMLWSFSSKEDKKILIIPA